MSSKKSTRRATVATAPVNAPQDPERLYFLHREMFNDSRTGLCVGDWMTNGHYMLKVASIYGTDRGTVLSDTALASKYKVEKVNRGQGEDRLPDFARVIGDAAELCTMKAYAVTPWIFTKYLKERKKTTVAESVLLRSEDGQVGYIARRYQEAFRLEPGMILYAHPAKRRDGQGCCFYDSRSLDTLSLVLMGVQAAGEMWAGPEGEYQAPP